MSEKPDWFKLTEEESSTELPSPKVSRRFAKLALLTVPLVLAGGAMVFAEGEDDDRPNIDTTITSTAIGSGEVSNSTTSNVSGKSSNLNSASNTVATEQVIANSNKSVANPAPAAPGAQKGAGVPAPSGNKGDDDGDHQGFFGGDDDDEHEGRERSHHERGEHEGRNGAAPTIPKSGTTTSKN